MPKIGGLRFAHGGYADERRAPLMNVIAAGQCDSRTFGTHDPADDRTPPHP